MLLLKFRQRPHRQDRTFVDDGDTVAELFHLAHDVRRENDALPLILQRLHRRQHFASDQHIQPGGRLVKDDDRRIVNDGSRDRNLLLHAGRHLRPQHIAEVVHLQSVEQPLQSQFQEVFRQAVQPAVVLDHFVRGHTVVDTRVVRHEPDPLPHLGRMCHHVVSGNRRDSARRTQHRAENPQAGRLAGSVGTEQSEDFAGLHVETHMIQRRDPAATQIVESLRELLHRNHGGRPGSGSRVTEKSN